LVHIDLGAADTLDDRPHAPTESQC
jgi:hypothetical protein